MGDVRSVEMNGASTSVDYIVRAVRPTGNSKAKAKPFEELDVLPH